MLDILSITGPIYITIIIGYVCTRLGLFGKADMRVFGKFVINLALPALLFNSLSQRPLAEILNGRYLLIYTVGSLVAGGLGLVWARLVMRQNPTASAISAMGMCSSNSGFVGYPIALLTLGPVAGVLLGLNMIVENLLVIPLMLALADRGQGAGSHWVQTLRQSLVNLVRNPMVMALVVGFVFALLQVKLPAPVVRTINLFSQASGALSLFVIGGALVGLEIKGMLSPVLHISAMKLLVHPLSVLATLLLAEAAGQLPMEPAMRAGAILLAACPMMGIYPILSHKYGQEGLSAAALLMATAASFVSISTILWLLHATPGWLG